MSPTQWPNKSELKIAIIRDIFCFSFDADSENDSFSTLVLYTLRLCVSVSVCAPP